VNAGRRAAESLLATTRVSRSARRAWYSGYRARTKAPGVRRDTAGGALAWLTSLLPGESDGRARMAMPGSGHGLLRSHSCRSSRRSSGVRQEQQTGLRPADAAHLKPKISRCSLQRCRQPVANQRLTACCCCGPCSARGPCSASYSASRRCSATLHRYRGPLSRIQTRRKVVFAILQQLGFSSCRSGSIALGGGFCQPRPDSPALFSSARCRLGPAAPWTNRLKCSPDCMGKTPISVA